MSRIDDLAASVIALEQRIAALEGRTTEPPPKVIGVREPDNEGMRILEGAAARAYIREPTYDLPSEDELRQLRRLVDAAFPALKFQPRNPRYADADAAEDWRGFIAAFSYVAELGRAEQVDTGKAVSWYVDGANAVLQAQGRGTDVNGRAFLAAAIAHGDVPYTSPAEFPALGLTIGGAGRRYAARWRDVLASGRVPQPVAKPGPPPAPRSPSQVLLVGSMPGSWQ